MIGHFLLTLTGEEEDRVLTRILQPGPYCGGCLMGTIYDIKEDDEGWKLYTDYADVFDPPFPPGHFGTDKKWMGMRMGTRYDYLCDRFGTLRVNAAIRNRILANRARRVWGSAPDLYIGASYKPGHSSDFPF